MKKFLVPLLAILLLTQCGSNKKASPKAEVTGGHEEYKTVVIDSCEYLEYYTELIYGNGYTTSHYRAKFITHKGNCKFCKERRKN